MKTIHLMVVIKNLDGGTGTFLKNLLTVKTYFKTRTLDITVLVLEKPIFTSGWPKDFLYFQNKQYPQQYTLLSKSFISFWKERSWIKEQIAMKKPAIVLGIDVHANILIQVIKLTHRSFSSLLTTHIDLQRTLREKASLPLYFVMKVCVFLLYNRADRLVCVSKDLSQAFAKDFLIWKKIKTIYYGVSFSREKSVSKERVKKCTIVSISRFDKQKDHPTLLRAFAKLVNEFPETRLVLVGDGSTRRACEKLAKELGIAPFVQFVGWKKDVQKLLQKSDVFVLSSFREGFPNALLEAMHAGLPVIATDAPYGPRELLKNGKYGILIPMANNGALYEALKRLVKSKKERMLFGREANERSKLFSLSTMLTEYKKTIDSLV